MKALGLQRASARLGLLALLGLAGCPANLENAEDVPPYKLAPPMPGTCRIENVENIFFKRCNGTGCHVASFAAAGGLDLQSPDVLSRLLDVQAKHLGLQPAQMASCSMTDKYIDTTDPANSWLLKKLSFQDTDTCGVKMPPIGDLSSADFNCLHDFVNSLATNAAGGTAGVGGASGAGGTGGASGASGTSGAAGTGAGGTAGDPDAGAGTAGTGGSAGT